MKPFRRRGLQIGLAFLVLCYLQAQKNSLWANPKKDISKLLRHIEDLYRMESSRGEIEIEIINPNFQRKLRVKVWAKGQDFTLVRVLSPAKEKGMTTLRRRREIWNFYPKISRTMKIPPSMMMASWMGSDFTNDDLVRESSLVRDYHAKVTGASGKNLIEVTLTPKKNTVTVWGKIRLEIDLVKRLPIKQVYYDELGRKIRTLAFRKLKNFSGRILPSELEMLPETENKRGRRTIIRYLSLQPDQLSEAFFSIRNLRKKP